MAFSLNSIKRGVSPGPPRIVDYGPHGVGKTSLAASAPSPLLLQFEDGEGLLAVPRHRVAGGWAELQEIFASLYHEPHDFATLGIDSLDWLEPVIFAEACARNGWATIEQPGYGKGYAAADDIWREFFAALASLRDARGMQVILLAHTEIKRFDDPAGEPYDRYRIKLQPRGAALAQEWADAVFFHHFKTYREKADVGFKKAVVRGKGLGERVLYTEERPSHYAKNRYGMPPEIALPDDPALSYAAIAAHLFPPQPATAPAPETAAA